MRNPSLPSTVFSSFLLGEVGLQLASRMKGSEAARGLLKLNSNGSLISCAQGDKVTIVVTGDVRFLFDVVVFLSGR